MILCSCAVIRQEELRDAIRQLHGENPSAPITPNRVYRKIGKTPTCMVCAPLLCAASTASPTRSSSARVCSAARRSRGD